ncbi:MAG TPA: long-chain-fatty-acid--CoA ligase [Polyangiales bacterium]|nr:long-chain-fatty-acid--CoA ligase [Polyangiales bacterium]
MQGLMQDWPLTTTSVLTHAYINHPEREIVSRTCEGPIHRYTYKDLYLRSKRCAKALQRLGIREGQVVATLAWNTYRHMEAWYGIMGIGAVCHTINPRLFIDQIVYIANHAEDRVLLLDLTFLPIAEAIQDRCPTITSYVILTDRAHMPATKLKNALCYEDLVAAEDENFEWPEIDERAAAGLCYTSGTTGNPKGVVYSHRSNVLHGMTVNAADVMGLRSVDSIMPIVPMFHANAWGIAFAAPMSGSKLVMPGAKLDGPSVYQLLEEERVTFTAAVPTVWLGLLQYLESDKTKKLESLERVVVGGAACPGVVIEKFERDYNVLVLHGWGMTEMSPMGTIGRLKAGHSGLSKEEQFKSKLKQGRSPYTVEMKIVDDDGKELPRDGKTFGHLLVRGPAIAKSYFKGEGGQILDKSGFFDTGDVATIDEHGVMQITDRAKDVIKSGGEWISSIEIENIAVGHPSVAEAAVIGLPHAKWGERPLLIVVKKPGAEVTRADMLSYLNGKIANWWMPDDVVFSDTIPHTATGKIQKRDLRDTWKDHQLPAK